MSDRLLLRIYPARSGALLTHGNLAMAAQSNLYGYSIGPEERVTLLSYLPLAHIYEVCWQFIDRALYSLNILAAASYSDGCRCSWGGHRLFHR
jgi:long-subunit acyl-CoA synthetase (AMP-forming)